VKELNVIVYLCIKDNIVVKYTKKPLHTNIYEVIRVNVDNPDLLIGREYKQESSYIDKDKFKLAVICNWGDRCGIATYSKYLIDALQNKVDEIKIFAEKNNVEANLNYNVEYSWNRGHSMLETIEKIKKWGATAVLIQHEFGIFPKGQHFLPMLQALETTPYALTLHSVYDGHKDKVIATSNIKNIIVHNQAGYDCLRRCGNTQSITVIPHGCIIFPEPVEHIWPHFGEYSLVQFGFGFGYKGVDVVLKAIRKLIDKNPKFNDIFYAFYLTTNDHSNKSTNQYYQEMLDLSESLNLRDNFSIQKGYLTDSQVNDILRTFRTSIFHYVTDPRNIVYGASGAVRLAYSNKSPVILSQSKMFTELEGVSPKPKTIDDLTNEIEKVLSSESYRKQIIRHQDNYVINNSWDKVADQYVKTLKEIVFKCKKPI